MWIARNKSGKLKLFENKPNRGNDCWEYSGNSSAIHKNKKLISSYFNIVLYANDFKDLLWTDEPKEITIERNVSKDKSNESAIYIARNKGILYPARTSLCLFNAIPKNYNGFWFSSKKGRWSCEGIVDISDEQLNLSVCEDDFVNLLWTDEPLRLGLTIK